MFSGSDPAGNQLWWGSSGVLIGDIEASATSIAAYAAANAGRFRKSRLTFNASKGSSIYTTGAHVRPYSYSVLFYIRY